MSTVRPIPRLFIPQPIRREGLALLDGAAQVEMVDTDRMLSRDELLAGLARTDFVLLIGDCAIDDDALRANPHIKGIACAARDVTSWVNLTLATSLGVPVSGLSPSAYTTICRSTADLTMALLLSLSARLLDADRHTRGGLFRQEQTIHFTWTTLTKRVLGMIGLGEVGRFVVPRARAFDLEIVYTKRQRLDTQEEERLGITWLSTIDEVLESSDFVSIQVSHNESTQNMIGARELQLMRNSAFLINTARGRIVDEPALIQALQDKVIAGAGLDVFWGEPPATTVPQVDPRLLLLDNVVLTPHIGGQAEDSLAAIARNQAENLLAMIDGERPPDLRNPEVYE